MYEKFFYSCCINPEAYYEIKSNLEDMGLSEFDVFCYHGIFRKKIAVIYGNCHTIPIKEILSLSEGFLSEYGFYPLRPICNIKDNNGTDLNPAVFENVICFCTNVLESKIHMGRSMRHRQFKKKKSSCTTLGIPNVYRMPMFLFPPIWPCKNGGFIWEKYNFFPLRDYYLDKYFDTMSIDELKDMILDDSLIPHHEITNSMAGFFEKLKSREEWDIKVSDFIYSNLREKHLFYDPNHPCTILLGFVANEILQILKFDIVNEFSNVYKLDHFELPIYASVKKALKLSYDIPY